MLRLVVASLFAFVAYNAADRATPISKVITLLESLKDKVNTEGTEEAKTYNTFACFCKDTMKAKDDAITSGQSLQLSLKASLDADMTARDTKDTEISSATTQIEGIEGDIKTATTDRHAAALQYEKEEVDLTGAIEGLSAAIITLKAAKTTVGFMQLRDLPDTVRQALLMAQALVPSSTQASVHGGVQNTVAALLEQKTVNASTTYKFQADGIISTLEDLKTQFKQKKTELDAAEVSARSTYDKLVQDKEALKKAEETKITQATTAKTQLQEQVTANSADLTATTSQVLDDQKYLSALSTKCNEKAILWEKRTTTRAEELNALAEAIQLMKGLIGTNSSFLQLSSRHSLHAAPGKSAFKLIQAVKAHVHAEVAAPAASQRSAVPALLKARRAHMVSLLKSKAQDLKSAILANMVEHAAADPFAKVKTMIQALIDKLLQQEASETSHKGWCDKEYSKNYQARDTEFAKIKELNLELEGSEARMAKLNEELAALTSEVKELNEALQKATTLRAQEKAESDKAIETAKEGKVAVEKAIDILDKFYKAAANNATDLLQQSAKADPEAGFDAEYAGMQSDSVGVLGMLEVVKSDFERTIKETEANEETAKKALFDLETSTGASVNAKNVALTERGTALNGETQKDTDNRILMSFEVEALGKTMTEIAAVDQACIQTGDTAEDRKLKREEEIEALKSALAILEAA